MYTNLFRRIAATGAALSVGSLAFLFGCNHHDRDCDSCDNQPLPHHVTVSDADYYDQAPAVNTTYEGNNAANGDVALQQNFEGDIYFQQHRLDKDFDRDAYIRDRGAYVRLHDGDEYWNGHRAELERGWGVNVNFDRNNRDFRDNRDNRDVRLNERAGFNREVNDIQHPADTSIRRNENATELRNRNVNPNNDRAINNDLKANAKVENRDLNAPKTEVTTPKAEVKTEPSAADRSMKANNDQSLKKDMDKEAPKTTEMKSEKTEAPVNTSTTPAADKPATSNNPGSETKNSATPEKKNGM